MSRAIHPKIWPRSVTPYYRETILKPTNRRMTRSRARKGKNARTSSENQMSKSVDTSDATWSGNLNNATGVQAGNYHILYPTLCGANNTSPTTIANFLSKVGNYSTFNDLGVYLGARVKKCRIKLTLVNLEAFPIVVNVVKIPFVQTALFDNANIATLMDSFKNTRSIILDKAGTTKDYAVINLTIDTSALEGRDTSREQGWVGSYTTVSFYQDLYIQIRAVTGAALVSGMDYKFEGKFDLSFTSVKVTTN